MLTSQHLHAPPTSSHTAKMDKFIDGRFERLEKSLASLIDSVTKYHPSVSLAEELKHADDELTKGLEQGRQRAKKATSTAPLTFRSRGASKQPPQNTRATANVRRPRHPNTRNPDEPRQHPPRHCQHPHHKVPLQPQLPHRLRGAPQLCAPHQQDDAAPRGHHPRLRAPVGPADAGCWRAVAGRYTGWRDTSRRDTRSCDAGAHNTAANTEPSHQRRTRGGVVVTAPAAGRCD